MSFEGEEDFLFGESESESAEVPMATEEEVASASTTTRSSESFPIEAFEVSIEMADLWNSAIEGKIPVDELIETKQALQATVEVSKRRRRRRR
jgi:hypothetical protein